MWTALGIKKYQVAWSRGLITQGLTNFADFIRGARHLFVGSILINIANQATAIKVDEAGFASALGGQDPHEIFKRFGAVGFGTRESVTNETNKRKLYLCVKFADDAQHVPAVAHFLSRIMPLHAGLVA